MKVYYKEITILLLILITISACNQKNRLKEYLVSGNEALKDRNYPLALQFYEKVIALDSSFAEAYNNMGIVYYEIGDYPAAIMAYDKAILYKPDLTDAYFNRANVFYEEKKYENALQDLGIVVKNYKDSGYVYFNRARTYLKVGKFKEATSDLNQVIQLDSENPDAYDSRGYLYYRQNNLEKAKEDLQKAIQLNSKQDFAYTNLGLLNLSKGKDSLALEYLNKAIEISNIEAYHFACRARYFIKQKDLVQAEKDMQEGLRLDNQNPDVLLVKAQLLLQAENLDEALTTAKKAQEMNPFAEQTEFVLSSIEEKQNSQN